MINILEKYKKITIKKGEITVSVTINTDRLEEYKNEEIKDLFATDELFARYGIKTFTGTAFLKDGDENNELEATRIAEAKMERQYYKYIKKLQKRKIKNITSLLNNLQNALAKTETNIEKTNSHIEEICERLR